MSNRRLHRALLVALAVTLAVPFAAAQATEIGSVDMNAVIEKSKVGSKVQEQLRKDFEPKAKPMGEEEQSIRQAQASLARESALMSKDQLEKKQAELKKRIDAFEKAAAPLQQQLMKAQQERSQEVLGPAQKAVDAVAKQKKLGMVIERNQSGLLFVDKALDITDDVIKQMDANTK
jgi:outer membrane protein